MKERVVMNLQARQLLGQGNQRGGGIPVLRGFDIGSLLDAVLWMEAGSIQQCNQVWEEVSIQCSMRSVRVLWESHMESPMKILKL